MKLSNKFNKSSKKSGFSFIELALVLAVIGALITGIIGGQKLVGVSKLTRARSQTKTSPVIAIGSAQTMDDISFWFDATSLESFDNLSPINNSSVSKWNDINPKNQSKHNALQGTSANQPKYMLTAMNGLPALQFDGVNDYLRITNNFSFDQSKISLSLFVVAQFTSSATTETILSQNMGTGTLNINILDKGATNLLHSSINGGNSGGPALFVPAIYYTDVVWPVSGNAPSQYYVNGVFVTGGGVGPPRVANSDLIIGASGDAASNFMNGYIGEIIVFKRHITTTERKDIESYLAQKWKIKLGG